MEPSETQAVGDIKGKSTFIIPEFSSFGGTRTYFTYLLSFYSRRGAHVTALLGTPALLAGLFLLPARLLAKALGRTNLRNKLLSPYIVAIAEKAR